MKQIEYLTISAPEYDSMELYRRFGKFGWILSAAYPDKYAGMHYIFTRPKQCECFKRSQVEVHSQS